MHDYTSTEADWAFKSVDHVDYDYVHGIEEEGIKRAGSTTVFYLYAAHLVPVSTEA